MKHLSARSPAARRRREPYPTVYFVVIFIVMLALHRFWSVAEFIPRPWSWSGLVLVALGLVLVYGTQIWLRRMRTTVAPYETPRTLVTAGPFRLSRNPVYLGFVIVATGAAIIFGTLTPFIGPPLLWWILDRRVVPIEEGILADSFDEDWRAYAARVRRWL